MTCPKILNRLPHKTLILVLTVLLTLFTLLLSRGFFNSGSNYMGADDVLLILLIPETGLLALALAAFVPRALRRDGDVPPVKRPLLALWVAVFLPLAVQLPLIVAFSLTSRYFTLHPVLLLLIWAALGALLLLWAAFFGLLYRLLGTGKWYFLGLLAVNVAPAILCEGARTLFITHATGIYGGIDILNAIPVTAMVGLLFNHPLLSAGLGAAAVAVALVLRRWPVDKKRWRPVLRRVRILCRMGVLLLAALAVGFLLVSPVSDVRSPTYSLRLAGGTLVTAIGLAALYYRRKRRLPAIGVAAVSTGLVVAALLVGIPALGQQATYTVPDSDTVRSVWFSTEGGGIVYVDDVEEMCRLHRELLAAMPEDYDNNAEQSHDHGTLTCLADIGREFTVSYTLRNGRTICREYRRLQDPAFDRWFLSLWQSNAYRTALMEAEYAQNLSVRCFYPGGVRRYLLEPEQLRELYTRYCDEMAAATEAVLYESLIHLDISAVSPYIAGDLYLPLSFTSTREWLETHLAEAP